MDEKLRRERGEEAEVAVKGGKVYKGKHAQVSG